MQSRRANARNPGSYANASPDDSRSNVDACAGKRLSHQRCADCGAITNADSRLRRACAVYMDSLANLDAYSHADA